LYSLGGHVVLIYRDDVFKETLLDDLAIDALDVSHQDCSFGLVYTTSLGLVLFHKGLNTNLSIETVISTVDHVKY
jgi:hypothetical protein